MPCQIPACFLPARAGRAGGEGFPTVLMILLPDSAGLTDNTRQSASRLAALVAVGCLYPPAVSRPAGLQRPITSAKRAITISSALFSANLCLLYN
ncbi:hypothetical protein CT19431_60118 [Cupriavidus taiwanensis]|nr:hypothetical protein CT19431_60118 [Cupriavidus taiwanensis]